MTTYADDPDFDDAPPPEESNNRTFLLAAGLLGGLVLLGLLCIAGYFFFSNNAAQQNEATAQAQAIQQAATLPVGLTQTSVAHSATRTASFTYTVPPTNTPV